MAALNPFADRRDQLINGRSRDQRKNNGNTTKAVSDPVEATGLLSKRQALPL
jgi:hypothetical protein